MRASFVPERKASPSELGPDLPVLSCRIIPSADGGDRPSVAELVRLDVRSTLRLSADGSPELYAGPATLSFEGGAADPWRIFKPTRVTGGFFAFLDFDLGFGSVEHDYLKDSSSWG